MRSPISSFVVLRRLAIALISGGLVLAGGSNLCRADSAKPAQAKGKITAQLAVIDLDGSYSEGPGQAGLFSQITEDLNRITERLDQAAKDNKISGVLLNFGSLELGRGKIHELRTAIARVRKAGKKVYAQLRSGETADYVLASSCDEIVMPESGTLSIAGVRAEVTFFKKLFDKLGIKAEILQKGAYKGTGEMFTRSSMSPEFHEDIDLLVDDFYKQLIDTIAADRKLDTDKVKSLIDEGVCFRHKTPRKPA